MRPEVVVHSVHLAELPAMDLAGPFRNVANLQLQYCLAQDEGSLYRSQRPAS
jgi:hypothetical protein